jgi:hypothetical protein
MDVKCYNCDHFFKADSNEAGPFICPHCGQSNQRTAPPISQTRKQLLERLESHEKAGFEYVTWISARDKCTCFACQEKDRQIFTISQMREILNSNFCAADEMEQGCRCIIGCADIPPLKQKLKPSKYKVTNKVIQKNDSVVIQLDLKKRTFFELIKERIKYLFSK